MLLSIFTVIQPHRTINRFSDLKSLSCSLTPPDVATSPDIIVLGEEGPKFLSPLTQLVKLRQTTSYNRRLQRTAVFFHTTEYLAVSNRGTKKNVAARNKEECCSVSTQQHSPFTPSFLARSTCPFHRIRTEFDVICGVGCLDG